MAYVSVEVDFDDVANEMDSGELIKELERALARRGKTVDVKPAAVTGDTTMSQYVERAYLAVRNLPNIPRELADMFWHVHDRPLT